MFLFMVIMLCSRFLGTVIKNLFLITGNFSGPKNHEFVVAKGSSIELLRPDDTGKMITIAETPVFSVVRSLMPFRLAGFDASDCFDTSLSHITPFTALYQVRTRIIW